jgi:hypothetical protein
VPSSSTVGACDIIIPCLLLAGCAGGYVATEHTSGPLDKPRLHIGPVQFMIPAGFKGSIPVIRDTSASALTGKNDPLSPRLNRNYVFCSHATEDDVQIFLMPASSVDTATAVAAMMRNHKDVTIHRKEDMTINGIEVHLVDSEHTEDKGRCRLITCVMHSGQGDNILTMVCPGADAPRWLPTFEEVVASIHLGRWPPVQPSDGDGLSNDRWADWLEGPRSLRKD